MNTYYLVKSARGKTIFFNFLSQFLYNFCRYFLNIYIKTKLFILIRKKNPKSSTIKNVFKNNGGYTFMPLTK